MIRRAAAILLALAVALPAGGAVATPVSPDAGLFDRPYPIEEMTLTEISYRFAGLGANALALPGYQLKGRVEIEEVFSSPSVRRGLAARAFDVGAATFPAGTYPRSDQIVSVVEQPARTLGARVTLEFSGPLSYTTTSPAFTLHPGPNALAWDMSEGGAPVGTARAGISLDKLMVEPSWDLFQTQGDMGLSLPADFFEPGSEPFDGAVTLNGEPIAPGFSADLGPSDTIVQRLDSARPLSEGSPVTVPIEIIALQLQSSAPITVTVRGCSGYPCPTQWDVRMDLSPSVQQPHGSMTVTKTHANGGTFTSEFRVQPRFTFTRASDGISQIKTLDTGAEGLPPLILDSSEPAPWVRQCGGLTIPHLNTCGGNFVPGVQEAGSPGGTHLTLTPTPLDAGSAPFIDPTASVDPGAHIASYATIEANAVIGNHPFVGPFAWIAPNAVLQNHAVVGGGAYVGAGASIGAQAVVGTGSVINDYARLADGARVGERSFVGFGATLSSGASLGAGGQLGYGAYLGPGTTTGIDVFIGDRTNVDPGLFITDHATIPSFSTQRVDLFSCLRSGGVRFPSTGDSCSAGGGAVDECVPAPSDPVAPPPPGQELNPQEPSQADADRLKGDVDGSKVAPGNGGKKWVKTTHDCDDFADELERALEAKGWHATFTVIYKRNPAWTPLNQKTTPYWDGAHAITDVHLPGGRMIWIEPQWTSGEGAVGVDLDRDGDGKIGYDDKPGTALTEGDTRVEIYESRPDAEAKGAVLD